MQLNYKEIDHFIDFLPSKWWSVGFVPFFNVNTDNDLCDRLREKQISAITVIKDKSKDKDNEKDHIDINEYLSELINFDDLFVLNLISMKDILSCLICPLLMILIIIYCGSGEGLSMESKSLYYTLGIALIELNLICTGGSVNSLNTTLKGLWEKLRMSSDRFKFASMKVNDFLAEAPTINIIIWVGMIACPIFLFYTMYTGSTYLMILQLKIFIIVLLTAMWFIKKLQERFLLKSVKNSRTLLTTKEKFQDTDTVKQ